MPVFHLSELNISAISLTSFPFFLALTISLRISSDKYPLPITNKGHYKMLKMLPMSVYFTVPKVLNNRIKDNFHNKIVGSDMANRIDRDLATGKIALVIPNFRWSKWEQKTLWDLFPYNLCLLAAMIEDKYKVEIIDANIDNMTTTEFSSLIQQMKPDVVGITMLTNEYANSAHIAARIVKQVDNSIIIVLGGVYATVSSEVAIMDDNIDYIVMGEGEYVFRDLLDYIYGGSESKPKNIVYKLNGEVSATPRGEAIENLDALPFPAYHKIDFMKYATHHLRESVDAPKPFPYARIITSRGCPMGCCFCEVQHIMGKKFRARSPDNIIDEIVWLKETYDIKSLIFEDDNLYLDKKRAKEILRKLIKKNLDLKLTAVNVPIFAADEELLGLLKAGGAQFVGLAIESGVERVLKEIIHKPVNLGYAKKLIEKIKELDMDVISNFIIGFPGETWDEIRQTIKFAEDIDVDYVKIFIATPLPKTELYRLAKEGGYLRDDFDFDKHCWSYGQIQTDEFTPGDLTILRAYEWDRINFSSPIKRKKIAEMMSVTEERLNQIRKYTLASAREAYFHGLYAKNRE